MVEKLMAVNISWCRHSSTELSATSLTQSVQPGTGVMILFNFAEKFGEKFGVFDSKQSKIMQNLDHNIGF
jgi:hypothetical protein